MRLASLGTAAAFALLMPLVTVPPTWAGPVAGLCTPDPARGSLPADFVLDACLDAAGVTVRNPLDVPVVVTASGDLGAAQRVDPSDDPQAALVRLSGGEDLVLVPGDVVRWAGGASAGEIAVSGLPAPAAVADALADLLPRRGDPDVPPDAYSSLATLVDVTAAAGGERAVCREGKNFLGMAACDVDAATAIGEAATVRLSRGHTNRAIPVILDAANWDEWAAVRPAPVGASAERTLRLAAAPVPVPVPAPPPVVVLPPRQPAPVPLPVPHPAPVPLPAAPAPVPAPAPVLPPVPSVPRWPTWQELIDRYTSAEAGNGNGNGKDKSKDKDKDD